MDKPNEKLILRPPVVVIMGHIDHGKSTLLDYIRKTNIVDEEAGGITQHIRAYEVEIPSENGLTKKITFVDTPGHEAFCAIRERGSRIADIAILVISAEDGLKPQTLEALKCVKKDGVPFIVAINKIDKNRSNVDKIKQSLAENEVLVEGWGGDVPIVLVSGKTGENVDELLELIILQAELEELKGDPSKKAEGFIIESSVNAKNGISSTIIIKNGTLKIGSFIATEGAYTRVRIIENHLGKNLAEASFSSPVRITGWNNVPVVGQSFKTFENKEEAIAFAKKNIESKIIFTENKNQDKEFFTIVVRADTVGSLEAIEHELSKLGNEKIVPKIVGKGIGDITENDIKNATIKNSLVLGFNVEANKTAEFLALRENINIQKFKVIYELVDYVSEKLRSATPINEIETITGLAKILRTFSKTKDKQVIGGKVMEGEIKAGSSVKIERRGNIIGEGKIKEIQTQKIKTGLVKEGDEFGMMLESKIELVEGDLLKAITFIKEQ